ncbi:hypothetical protein B0O99DRAFT_689361 [Bisporella sp. PMI_857]|nr:hypothetical protein B0O99DRAFT_689361 [Bisporella sp. PMI_857]
MITRAQQRKLDVQEAERAALLIAGPQKRAESKAEKQSGKGIASSSGDEDEDVNTTPPVTSQRTRSPRSKKTTNTNAPTHTNRSAGSPRRPQIQTSDEDKSDQEDEGDDDFHGQTRVLISPPEPQPEARTPPPATEAQEIARPCDDDPLDEAIAVWQDSPGDLEDRHVRLLVGEGLISGPAPAGERAREEGFDDEGLSCRRGYIRFGEPWGGFAAWWREVR